MASKTVNHAAVLPGKELDLVIQERDIPTPGPTDVVVRNHCIPVNPLDWRRQAWGFKTPHFPIVLGQDVCGEVVKVGSQVTNMKPGDRVVGTANGLSTFENDRGAFQEYSLALDSSVSRIPDRITYAQGATLGTNVGTAIMVFHDLWDLPKPSATAATAATRGPATGAGILIWGAASSNGFLLVQYARHLGFKVFATASERNHAYLRSLGAAAVADYHSPAAEQELVDAARAAGVEISYAIDTVATPDTLPRVLKAVSTTSGGGTAKGGTKARVCSMLPGQEDPNVDEGIDLAYVNGAEIWDRRRDLGYWMSSQLATWLEEGVIVPGKYRVVEGGLRGLQAALDELKQGGGPEKLMVKLI